MMSLEWIEHNYAQMLRRIFLATSDLESTDSQVTVDGVPVRKLFVSNLAQRSTFKDLQKCFSTYGNIESCYLRRNKKSNYAFVTFFKVEDAKQALEDGICKQVRLHNKDLKVLPADSWHQPDNMEKPLHKMYESSSETSSYSSSDEAPNLKAYKVKDPKCRAEALTNIFSNLSFKHRFVMEEVCKNWQIASKQREAWTDLKKLSLTSEKWKDMNVHSLRTATLRRILERGGRFLKELDLSYPFHCLGLSTVSVIANFCFGVESLDLSGLPVSSSSLDTLALHCQQLRKLTLGTTLTACDTELANLINKTHLEYLALKRTNIIGTCLLFLRPEEISTLIVDRCEELQDVHFVEALKKLKLTCLEVRFSSRLQVKTLRAICDCTTLKSLQLDGNLFKSDVAEHLLNTLPTKLANLTNLTLIYVTCLNNVFFQTLALSCTELTFLNLAGCRIVRNERNQHNQHNEELAWIARLPKLKKLILNHVNIHDDSLSDLHGLTHFECRRCNIGNVGITGILRRSPDLQVLDLSGCYLVTDDILDVANEISRNRHNNLMLNLYIGGTNILTRQNHINNPWLRIVNVNLSDIVMYRDDLSILQRNLQEELGEMEEEREEEMEEEREEETEEEREEETEEESEEEIEEDEEMEEDEENE